MSLMRMVSEARWAALAATLAVLSVAVAACGGGTSEPAAMPATAEAPQPTEPPQSPPTQDPGINVALASSDLGVGDNRVAFGLIDAVRGAIKGAQVQVQTFFVTNAGAQGPSQTVDAVFREWPGGFGGVYVAMLSFDQPGNWMLGVSLLQPDGSTARIGTIAQVGERSRTPPIGSPAPRSDNKSARDVTSLDELTTDTAPDPELYAMTIAEALQEDAPLLVTFATPAYCTSATCGPQVDVVKGLKERHGAQMNFIHIEVYDNPPEIREGVSSRRGYRRPWPSGTSPPSRGLSSWTARGWSGPSSRVSLAPPSWRRQFSRWSDSATDPVGYNGPLVTSQVASQRER